MKEGIESISTSSRHVRDRMHVICTLLDKGRVLAERRAELRARAASVEQNIRFEHSLVYNHRRSM
jgi:hypothetical protein